MVARPARSGEGVPRERPEPVRGRCPPGYRARVRTRRAGAGVLLAVLVLVGACATPIPGTPTPVAPTSASPTSAVLLRPRDIDVSGILPCELLTPAQQAELGFDGEPQQRSGSDPLFGTARTCLINRRDTRPAYFASITLVVEYGIERFSEPGIIAGTEPIQIASYPAVLSPPPPSMPSSCLVAVDIAPGQMVAVQLSDGGSEPGYLVEELCSDVPRYAEAVMETLLAR